MSIKVDGDIPTEFVIDEIARTTAIVLGENAALKEENKRLREALEKIFEMSTVPYSYSETKARVEQWQRFARSALKEE